MSDIKKQTWTESEVLALPPGQEHDYFDRKSGALITKDKFREDLAKDLSAFANSGGGHLILGMCDDGKFDGVAAKQGRTSTREWIEQITPDLLVYSLQDFRVHEFLPNNPSVIPAGQVVIVLDVGDSGLAPHQAAVSKIYYRREGGHSVPAPHFYLEMLRNRLARPALEPTLKAIKHLQSSEHDGGVFLDLQLQFEVLNSGRVAAYKWALVVTALTGPHAESRRGDYYFNRAEFPVHKGRSGGVPLDLTILPSLFMLENRDFGIQLRPKSLSAAEIEAELRAMIPDGCTLQFRAVSEVSPGVPTQACLSQLIDYKKLANTPLTAPS
jgi:hypothetical protein